jgi:hypothetical protein
MYFDSGKEAVEESGNGLDPKLNFIIVDVELSCS